MPNVLLDLAEFRAKLIAEKRSTIYIRLSEKYGVNPYYLWNIINSPGYKPPARICAILGIKFYLPAPICRKCGGVHVTKYCTANRKPWRDWHYHFGMTDDLLEKRLNWPN